MNSRRPAAKAEPAVSLAKTTAHGVTQLTNRWEVSGRPTLFQLKCRTLVDETGQEYSRLRIPTSLALNTETRVFHLSYVVANLITLAGALVLYKRNVPSVSPPEC